MPGASWMLLDSVGAATCSAAALFVVDESADEDFRWSVGALGPTRGKPLEG